jgi:two-component system response regulator YesN
VYKLLIVDDEPIIRKGILSFVNMEELNISEVFEAADGKAALELFKEKLPDLLLIDINIPKMNGLELASACKDIKPEVRICLVTGYDYFDYAVKALKLGVDDYILKPSTKKDIGEMLGKLINKITESRYKSEVEGILDGLSSKPRPMDEEGYKAKIYKEIEENIGNSEFSLYLLADKMGLSFGYLSGLF